METHTEMKIVRSLQSDRRSVDVQEDPNELSRGRDFGCKCRIHAGCQRERRARR
jgi:hypothetical protein